MIATNQDGFANTWPIGHYNNPVLLDGPIPADYPGEFKDRPYVYMQPKGGDVTQVYRSYSDYCD